MFADPVTPGDVTRAVRGFMAVGEAYVILSDSSDDEWYVQGAGTVSEGFIIERRDGCAGEHYRGDHRVSADELVGILVSCVRGAASWSHALTWHRVRVDFGAVNARA
jgi:curved DNA-binding protein CbpA